MTADLLTTTSYYKLQATANGSSDKLLEVLHAEVHNAIVEVLTAQMGVARCCLCMTSC